MTDPLHLETALRLAGERWLRGDQGQSVHDGNLAEISTALVLLCGLDRDVASTVLDDYSLAASFRGGGRVHRRHRDLHSPAASPAVPVFVPCAAELDLPDGRARVESVTFTADSCDLAMTHPGAPPWAQAGAGHTGPATLQVVDDRGVAAAAHFSGSGGDDGWSGRWTTEAPLSADTRWLDVSGARLALGPPTTPSPVRIEELPDEPMVYRYLWHRHAVGGHHTSDDVLLRVLVELGVLAADDPVLDALAKAAENGRARREPGAPATACKLWAGLAARRHREDGPTGSVAVAALTPTFDGTVVVVAGLHSTRHGFTVRTQVSGEHAAMGWRFHGSDGAVPLAWWADDDRGNSYLGQLGSFGGSPGSVAGDIQFDALDPAARRLRLMPTGLRQRAVIELDIPGWHGTDGTGRR